MLGILVFEDEHARKRLNAIVHPIIEKMTIKRLADIEKEHPGKTAVVDARAAA